MIVSTSRYVFEASRLPRFFVQNKTSGPPDPGVSWQWNAGRAKWWKLLPWKTQRPMKKHRKLERKHGKSTEWCGDFWLKGVFLFFSQECVYWFCQMAKNDPIWLIHIFRMGWNYQLHPGIPTTIKTMGVNITTIVYLRVLIIQIGEKPLF